MTTIYGDYSDEPPDVFEALPETLATRYYNLEMAGYTDDFPFYDHFLPSSGRILELGCGSGRLARLVRQHNCSYTGLDRSLSALQDISPRPAGCRFICGDMRQWAFATRFNAILIPYNTLNLLLTREEILQCLSICREHLQQGGLLLAQLYIATTERIQNKKRTFQFRMLSHPDGGKIIKEILQGYRQQTRTLQIEERFRIRPTAADAGKKDYRTNFAIAALPLAEWLSLFTEAGFSHCGLYGDSSMNLYTPESSSLYAVLTPALPF